MSARCLKRTTQIALAHFVWHFIVGKPWDSTTIIAKKICLGYRWDAEKKMADHQNEEVKFKLLANVMLK